METFPKNGSRTPTDRKAPRSTGKKLKLFSEEELGQQYRYSLLVTNLSLPADEVWALYRRRADAENRIKELKYDFAADGFCLKKFWATEAAFRFVMMAYNLMSLFRHLTLQTASQATLHTLKFQCFAMGSWITKHAGKKILKLSVNGPKRTWLTGLFEKVRDSSPPYDFSIA